MFLIWEFRNSGIQKSKRAQVSQRCDRALVYGGTAWDVPDRRTYVVDMRRALTAAGVMAVFFEWRNFKMVIFADMNELDREALSDQIETDDFRRNFGVFNTESVEEVMLV